MYDEQCPSYTYTLRALSDHSESLHQVQWLFTWKYHSTLAASTLIILLSEMLKKIKSKSKFDFFFFLGGKQLKFLKERKDWIFKDISFFEMKKNSKIQIMNYCIDMCQSCQGVCTRVLWFTIILGEAFPLIYNQALEICLESLLHDGWFMHAFGSICLSFSFWQCEGELSAGCYSTGQPAAS